MISCWYFRAHGNEWNVCHWQTLQIDNSTVVFFQLLALHISNLLRMLKEEKYQRKLKNTTQFVGDKEGWGRLVINVNWTVCGKFELWLVIISKTAKFQVIRCHIREITTNRFCNFLKIYSVGKMCYIIVFFQINLKKISYLKLWPETLQFYWYWGAPAFYFWSSIWRYHLIQGRSGLHDFCCKRPIIFTSVWRGQ